MKPASWPRSGLGLTRLLAIDPARRAFADLTTGNLPSLLRAGDVLVVNDAATLPASLHGTVDAADNAPIEIRLAGTEVEGRWRAVLFGAGDWRTRTEDRPPPPLLRVGSQLRFQGLTATVTAVDAAVPRLLSLLFAERGAKLWRALYHAGRPVQYAHIERPLPLWLVQTAYATRPWAAEAPSAGFALSWELLLGLRTSGVELARVTHAAGLSSTGDAALDARLPLAEHYDIPVDTVRVVDAAKRRGNRVLAVGTTVARALEGAAKDRGFLVAGAGDTELLLGPRTRLRVVDGLVTGAHDAGTSHFRLLEAFAPRALLERAHEFAAAAGYRGHEFGDAVLVLPSETGELQSPSLYFAS